MNKIAWGFLVVIFIGILISCVTVQDRTLPPEERSSAEVIGRVNARFVSIQPLHIQFKDGIAKKAYSKLMAEARKKYQGNIEVVNITADGSFNGLTLLPLPWIYGFIGNFQTIKASGDVIVYSGSISSTIPQNKMAEGAKILSEKIAIKLPKDTTIAVLSIYSSNKNSSEFIIGELEYNLVNSGKFKIVDRRRLDQIRTEQNFQLSGDVSDNSAVEIGNMLGANIVITGEITGSGLNQRLVIKALDVKTAQIIAMEREQL